jgi:DNA-binding XRE family transcriptional regulator
MYKDLSRKIICYRAENNLNQEQFAEKCNLTQQTICNIENGKQKPSKITLQKILNIIEG